MKFTKHHFSEIQASEEAAEIANEVLKRYKKELRLEANTAIEMHRIAREYSLVEVPWSVWTKFGEKQKSIIIVGEDICLGEDYTSLEGAREAVQWYVEQLGGKVKWEKA